MESSRLSLPCIQRLTSHTGCPHFLHRVAIRVSNGSNGNRGRLALLICSRKVRSIVVNDCSHAGLLIAVVCHELSALRHLMGDREVTKCGELRVHPVIGFRLDVVQLSCKEHGSVLSAIKPHLRNACNLRHDVGLLKLHQILLGICLRRHFCIVGLIDCHVVVSSLLKVQWWRCRYLHRCPCRR